MSGTRQELTSFTKALFHPPYLGSDYQASADLEASSAQFLPTSAFWRLSCGVAASCISGTDSRQTRPSERQSNSACPPSCDSMLAITLLVPNPRDTGFSTTVPFFSSPPIPNTSASASHLIERRPDRVERAPHFAQLW